MRALRCVLLQLLFSPGVVGGHGVAVLPFGLLLAACLGGRDQGIMTALNVPIYLCAVALSFGLETMLAKAARARDERHAQKVAAAREQGADAGALERALSEGSPRL